jgi:hypothetical protein
MGTRLPFHGAMAQELLTENGLCVMAAGLGLNQARYPFVAVPLTPPFAVAASPMAVASRLRPIECHPDRSSQLNHHLAPPRTHPRCSDDWGVRVLASLTQQVLAALVETQPRDKLTILLGFFEWQKEALLSAWAPPHANLRTWFCCPPRTFSVARPLRTMPTHSPVVVRACL